ncbi:hypothetical protein [Rhodovulum sp. MB263]|uniref:hypothetical protein n=1 Tax=Rhodovulum sp. (strain MB263) TaxID=308754 RepID=UPI0012DB5872|nr:hypothetical protein [Rhodovulum sp. MB263]
MTKSKNRPRLASWRDAEAARDSPQTDIIPVALISLDDATGRRDHLRQAGFPPDLVGGYWPASDLRKADEAELAGSRIWTTLPGRSGAGPFPAKSDARCPTGASWNGSRIRTILSP